MEQLHKACQSLISSCQQKHFFDTRSHCSSRISVENHVRCHEYDITWVRDDMQVVNLTDSWRLGQQLITARHEMISQWFDRHVDVSPPYAVLNPLYILRWGSMRFSSRRGSFSFSVSRARLSAACNRFLSRRASFNFRLPRSPISSVKSSSKIASLLLRCTILRKLHGTFK